jgi:ribosomal protein S27E
MIEGYCVKCKARRPVADAVEEQMKNGRKAVKGKCPVCGAVMFKILGGKSVIHPSPAEGSGEPLSDPSSAAAADGIVPSAPAPG